MAAKKSPGRPKADSARDLRADLLQASRVLLDEGGPGALSLREVARRTGCTHQAPYHYFADRETLLATLVGEGFDELARQLRLANDLAVNGTVRDTLVASGRAYVGFALSQPGVFRIMFRPDMCNPQRFGEVLEAGGRARAELDRLNVIVHGAAATVATASVLWAHVHGLACLLIDGPLGVQFQSDRQLQAHLREVSVAFAEQVLGKAA
jgi:AcrR family transcriptional regulator